MEGGGGPGGRRKRECRSGGRTNGQGKQPAKDSGLVHFPPTPFSLFLSLLLRGEELRLHLKEPHSLKGRACP